MGELSGGALLPAPFLVYIGLCSHYNKRTCWIRLSPVVLAAEHHHCTASVVTGACQETYPRPRRPSRQQPAPTPWMKTGTEFLAPSSSLQWEPMRACGQWRRVHTCSFLLSLCLSCNLFLKMLLRTSLWSSVQSYPRQWSIHLTNPCATGPTHIASRLLLW